MEIPNERLLNYWQGRSAIDVQHIRAFDSSKPTLLEYGGMLADIYKDMDSYIEQAEGANAKGSGMYLAWRQVVEAKGPFSHLFTLCFIHPYSDEEAIGALRTWCSMMNRVVKGPRWKRKGSGFSGIAVAERHGISLDFRGRLHFHVLLDARDVSIDLVTLQSITHSCALILKDSHDRQMTDLGRVDLREVTKQERLIGYLLKDLYSPEWKPGDNIGFLCGDTGFEGFPFSKQTATALRKMH